MGQGPTWDLGDAIFTSQLFSFSPIPTDWTKERKKKKVRKATISWIWILHREIKLQTVRVGEVAGS